MAQMCILVDEDRGRYQIALGARRQPWSVVKGQAENTERVESLAGWGQWTAAYQVDGVWYFVEELEKRP